LSCIHDTFVSPYPWFHKLFLLCSACRFSLMS
jgi:hypothetical protein